MPTEIEPISYAKELNRTFNYHAISSVLLTIANGLFQWNGMFANVLFSQTLSTELNKNNSDDNSKFYTISWSIAGGLAVIPSLAFCFVVWILFSTMKNKNTAPQNTTEQLDANLENTAIAEWQNRCKALVKSYEQYLSISGKEIDIDIVKNNELGASSQQLFFFTKRYISLTTGFLDLVKKNQASLEITLAHECVHLYKDLPAGSTKGLIARLNAINTPWSLLIALIQTGYFIGAPIVFGFKPAYLYAITVSFILCAVSIFITFHRMRLKETRADFEALFSGIPFSQGEYQKEIQFFSQLLKEDKAIDKNLSCVTRCFFSMFATHPPEQDRIDMIQAALTHNESKKTDGQATVRIAPEDCEEEQSETSTLLPAA